MRDLTQLLLLLLLRLQVLLVQEMAIRLRMAFLHLLFLLLVVLLLQHYFAFAMRNVMLLPQLLLLLAFLLFLLLFLFQLLSLLVLLLLVSLRLRTPLQLLCYQSIPPTGVRRKVWGRPPKPNRSSQCVNKPRTVSICCCSRRCSSAAVEGTGLPLVAAAEKLPECLVAPALVAAAAASAALQTNDDPLPKVLRRGLIAGDIQWCCWRSRRWCCCCPCLRHGNSRAPRGEFRRFLPFWREKRCLGRSHAHNPQLQT